MRADMPLQSDYRRTIEGRCDPYPASILAVDSPEEAICAILRHESTPWINVAHRAAIQRFYDAARYHGVLPLLDAQFARGDIFEAWPRDVVAAWYKSVLACGLREPAQRAEIERVIDALALAGVPPLVLKGTALAYSHYPAPALRPRSDTDLLIPPDQREKTARALAALGYSKGQGVGGEFASYQQTWSRGAGNGIAHHVDVHWRINNSQILAQAMSYDELAARAVPLPALGPRARALAPVDALLFACVHLTGHVNAPYFADNAGQRGAERLIWLYDMHLLFSRMADAEQDEFAALAATKKIKTICRDALQRTQECFATLISQRIVDALYAPGPAEPSARYFSGGPVRQMIGDFLAFECWSDRARWLAEHAFPSQDHMRSKYPEATGTWLPILHLRRLGTGLARMIFARKAGDRH